MARIWIGRLCALLLLAGTQSLLPISLEQGGRATPGFGRLQLSGVEAVQARDGSLDLRLSRQNRHGERGNLLYLDFEQGPAPLLRDQASNYRIQVSSYIETTDSRAGRGAALFNRRENRIQIRSPEELWPGVEAVDDFTIETWLKPVYPGRSDLLFRKSSLIGGQRQGLEIRLQNGLVVVDLSRLFVDARGARQNARLRSSLALPAGRWSHIAFRFEAASGRLSLAINGEEDDIRLARDDRGVWTMQFHPDDRSGLFIGEGFSGVLDEFRIADRAIPIQELKATLFPRSAVDYSLPTMSGFAGEAQSEVIALPERDRAESARIRFRGQAPADGALVFFVRSSTAPFDPNTPESRLPWRRLQGDAASIERFGYIQWRARFYGSPAGDGSPLLESVHIDYQPVRPPLPPLALRLLPELSGPLSVCLEWEASASAAVQRGGGYRIYYGYRSGEYIGRLDVLDDGRSPIRSPRALDRLTAAELDEQSRRPQLVRDRLTNRMRLVIDNRLITANSPRNLARPQPPQLIADQAYYFVVAAYDAEGEESDLSNETVVFLRAAGDLR